MCSLEVECSTNVQQRAGSGSRLCANPEMLRLHHSADPDHRSANWGHSELRERSGRKNPPACSVLTKAILFFLLLLDLVSSVLCQEIGQEECRNDLFCVE